MVVIVNSYSRLLPFGFRLYQTSQDNTKQYVVISTTLIADTLSIGSSFEITSSVVVDSRSKKVPCSFVIVKDLNSLRIESNMDNSTTIETENDENQIFDWIEACLFIYQAHETILETANKEHWKVNISRIARNMRVDRRRLQESFKRYSGSKAVANAMKTFCSYLPLTKAIIIQKELNVQKTVQELQEFRDTELKRFNEQLVCVSMFTVLSLQTVSIPILEVMVENQEIAAKIEQQYREIVETGQLRIGIEQNECMKLLSSFGSTSTASTE